MLCLMQNMCLSISFDSIHSRRNRGRPCYWLMVVECLCVHKHLRFFPVAAFGGRIKLNRSIYTRNDFCPPHPSFMLCKLTNLDNIVLYTVIHVHLFNKSQLTHTHTHACTYIYPCVLIYTYFSLNLHLLRRLHVCFGMDIHSCSAHKW